MSEIVGRLQDAIRLLEEHPDKEASQILARRILQDTESFSSFSLVSARRKRISEFLEGLENLDAQDAEAPNEEEVQKSIDAILRGFYKGRKLLEEWNLFDRMLHEDLEGGVVWDANTGGLMSVEKCSGDQVIAIGAYSSRWLLEKLLVDMIEYYDTHVLFDKDFDLIGNILGRARDELDAAGITDPYCVRIFILYKACMGFLGSQNVEVDPVYGGVYRIAVFDRSVRRRIMTKYNDEYRLESVQLGEGERMIASDHMTWDDLIYDDNVLP